MGKIRKSWNKEEIDNLKKFIKIQEKYLISNFYKNIRNGSLEIKKKSSFFREMSKYVLRSPTKCKSKFQKIEETIYIEYLKIPEDHYIYFLYLRQKKPKKKEIENEKLNEAEEWKLIEMNKLKEKILSQIQSGKIKTYFEEEEMTISGTSDENSHNKKVELVSLTKKKEHNLKIFLDSQSERSHQSSQKNFSSGNNINNG